MNIKLMIKKFLFTRDLKNAVDVSEQFDCGASSIQLHGVYKKYITDLRSNVLDTLFYVRFSVINSYSDHNKFSLRVSTQAFRNHNSIIWIATRELVDGRFEHLYSYVLKEDLPHSVISCSYKDRSLLVSITHETLVHKDNESDLAHCHCVRDTVYDLWQKERMRRRISEIKSLPPCSCCTKFSFIIPFYKTDPILFDELLSDIRNQTYGNWELIAINASPEDDILCDKIKYVARIDSRVKIVTLNKNLGITLNSVEGAKIASGNYLCFCDHDDRLEPTILEEYARAIESDPDIGLLYCDEDLLYTSTDGHLGYPAIKPDYSPVKIACTNYICHMLTVRNEIYQEIVPSTDLYDGSQDYKLTLDAILQGAKVHHIGEPLYHWRCCETSSAGDISQKTYALKAGRKATSSYLHNLNILFKESDRLDYMLGFYFNDYIMKKPKTLQIIIPVLDRCSQTKLCVNSVLDQTLKGIEIAVGVAKGGEILDSEIPDTVTIQRYKRDSKSFIINDLAKLSTSDYICIMNPNVVMNDDNILEQLVAIMELPSVHGICPRLIDDSGFSVSTMSTFGRGSVAYSDTGFPFHVECATDQIMLHDDFMVISRDDFNSVKGYDIEFPHTLGDADFSLRLRDSVENKGERCTFVLQSDLMANIHKFTQVDGITRDCFDDWKDSLAKSNVRSERNLYYAMDLFSKRHAKRIDAGDPFYSDKLDKFKMNHRFDIEFLLK